MVGGVEPALSIAASTSEGIAKGCCALHSAAAPLTYGAAILVPLPTAYPVPLNVESMFTPGAAIFTAGPKLLKNANVSSGTVALSPLSVKIGSSGAHTPSLSPIEETVITFGLLTGVVADASFP